MDRSGTGRIEAFSDGIIGIAATLLILEVKVPPLATVHSIADLWTARFNQWPSYFAFIYSFGFIWVAWVNYPQMLQYVARPTRSFAYANGFLLMTITVLPFPTALLAQYLATPYQQAALLFFCASSLLNSVAWVLLTECMVRTPGLVKPIDRALATSGRTSVWFGGMI